MTAISKVPLEKSSNENIFELSISQTLNSIDQFKRDFLITQKSTLPKNEWFGSLSEAWFEWMKVNLVLVRDLKIGTRHIC